MYLDDYFLFNYILYFVDMNFISIVLFLLITIHTSIPNDNKKIQNKIFQVKEKDSIIANSDLDNVSMMEGSYNLITGQKIDVEFNKPYGLILMRSWNNIILEIVTVDPKTGIQSRMNPIEQGESKIGVYFGEFTGRVTLIATKNTYVSFAQADFPKDCDYKYISNTLKGTISLKTSNYLDGSTFCYFNTAKLPITYALNYSLGEDNLRVLTNSNEDINATKQGYIDKTLTIPAFIKIITGKDIKKNHYVNLKMASINDEKPKYKYSGFVKSQSPVYIVGEKKKSKISSSTIATIVVTGVIFLALVVYAFSYLCLSHKRKHHRHNHHRDSNNNHNNNNNTQNSNNNNSNNTNNNTNNNNNANNNENQDENAQEKELIENGRYKTPAHVNIELISSQFDQKYKTSNPSFFSRKSSSHFENDKGMDEEENNGYPLNEYKPPSKGILAPTSISDFSENVNPDDDTDEDNDLENVKEAPFRKSTFAESKENLSDSD